MKKFTYSLFIIFLTLLSTGCQKSQNIVPTINVGETKVDVYSSSYCLNKDGKDNCKSWLPPAEAIKDITPTKVSSTTKLEFHYKHTSENRIGSMIFKLEKDGNVTQMIASTEIKDKETIERFDLPKEKGIYIGRIEQSTNSKTNYLLFKIEIH